MCIYRDTNIHILTYVLLLPTCEHLKETNNLSHTIFAILPSHLVANVIFKILFNFVSTEIEFYNDLIASVKTPTFIHLEESLILILIYTSV